MIISIITINYNNRTGLLKTINSVAGQNNSQYEFIVVDGLSNDGSIEVIEEYKNIFAKVIIEKDNGIYDAMNKGLKEASGDFVLFLNSGDIFFDENSLLNFVSNITRKERLYFARAMVQYKDVSWFVPNSGIKKNKINKCIIRNYPIHQTVLCPKIYYKINHYQPELIVASDHDYIFRCIKKYGYYFIDEICINFELGGVSTYPDTLIKVFSLIKDDLENADIFLKNIFHKSIIVLKYAGKYILIKIIRNKTVYFKIVRFAAKIKNLQYMI